MSNNNSKRLELINTTFNSLNKDNLDVLNVFYADNVEFTDPVTQIKGLPDLIKYYSHVYTNVMNIKFEFNDITVKDNTYFAKWTMKLQVKGLNSQKPYQTEGLSVMSFNEDNKVFYHRDYVDLGSMVYEHIPVLGNVIKLIKRKLA